MTGYSYFVSNFDHAFLYDGTMQDLEDLGGGYSCKALTPDSLSQKRLLLRFLVPYPPEVGERRSQH